MSKIVRFGVSIEKELLEKFDKMNEGIYNNRSEAIRDLIRDKIVSKKWQNKEEIVIGSITLVYDHHQRILNDKMLKLQHKYCNIFKANLHIHLDHNHCLEVIVVKGKVKQLIEISNQLISLKGVKHGKLTISNKGTDF